MFDALDESIKKLLEKEISIKKNEIDIVFDQPTDEWSSGITKPTLNVYLFEIKENRALRGAEQFFHKSLPDGAVEINRNPFRVDVYYLITVWTKKEQDQHHLLGSILTGLLRSPVLPAELYTEGIPHQDLPIQLEVANTESSKDWSEFWSTLNNKYHPGITLKVTVTIDPFAPVITPAVSKTEIGFKQQNPLTGETSPSKQYWSVGGKIVSDKYSPSTLTLTWEEKGKELTIDNGGFMIQKAQAGTYHLAVSIQDRILKRHRFTIPSEESIIIEV